MNCRPIDPSNFRARLHRQLRRELPPHPSKSSPEIRLGPCNHLVSITPRHKPLGVPRPRRHHCAPAFRPIDPFTRSPFRPCFTGSPVFSPARSCPSPFPHRQPSIQRLRTIRMASDLIDEPPPEHICTVDQGQHAPGHQPNSGGLVHSPK